MLRKISMSKAHKKFALHETFYMCPSRVHPTFWGHKITRTSFEQLAGISFDTMVNAFQYYNCNAETGKRVVFYEEIG